MVSWTGLSLGRSYYRLHAEIAEIPRRIANFYFPGVPTWRDAGYEVETAGPTVEAVPFVAAPRTQWLATMEDVKARVAVGDAWLGDVRSVEEFAGRTSGYSYLDARGRLTGALHLGDADDGSPLYVAAGGRLRPPADVLALWQKQGLHLCDDGRAFQEEAVPLPDGANHAPPIPWIPERPKRRPITR
jgi:hypothetical protein